MRLEHFGKIGTSGNFVNKIHNFHDQNIVKSIEDNWLDRNLSSKKDSSEDDDFTVPSEQDIQGSDSELSKLISNFFLFRNSEAYRRRT